MAKLSTNTLAGATIAVIGAFASTSALSMTIATPAGLSVAVQDTSNVQDAAYICRRIWRCGYFGCGWRRVCFWGPRYDYGYYRPYRYGWGYRHRDWW